MTTKRKRTPKPPMMHHGEPCERCKGEWYFTAIDMDPDAEEVCTYAVCVACRHAPNRPSRTPDVTPE